MELVLVPTMMLASVKPHWIASFYWDPEAQLKLFGVRVSVNLSLNLPTNGPMIHQWRAYYFSWVLEAPLALPILPPANPQAQNGAQGNLPPQQPQ